jgi:hypothetical protein
MDLREQLEEAIGPAPPLPPPAERVAAGRAALRRRRLTVGAGALVAAAALVAPFAVGGASGTRGVDPAPAVTRPTDPPTVRGDLEAGRLGPQPEREHRTYTAETYPWRGDTVAAIDFDGDEPFIRPGAVVLQRREGLFPGSEVRSVALVIRYAGTRYWVAMDWTHRGGTIGQNEAGEGFGSFDDFVDDFVVGGPTTQESGEAP